MWFMSQIQEIRMNILDRMGIPSTTIGAGKTINFSDHDGQAFYVHLHHSQHRIL